MEREKTKRANVPFIGPGPAERAIQATSGLGTAGHCQPAKRHSRPDGVDLRRWLAQLNPASRPSEIARPAGSQPTQGLQQALPKGKLADPPKEAGGTSCTTNQAGPARARNNSAVNISPSPASRTRPKLHSQRSPAEKDSPKACTENRDPTKASHLAPHAMGRNLWLNSGRCGCQPKTAGGSTRKGSHPHIRSHKLL